MTTHLRRRPRTTRWAALTSLTVALAATAALSGGAAATSHGDPIVNTHSGAVRGAAMADSYAFRGVPYAAPPTGHLRWRPPQPVARWRSLRDATEFAPSCPQQQDLQQNPFVPPGALKEDCLYLNVYTPELAHRHGRDHPVLVWIHGGGLAIDAARNYDPRSWQPRAPWSSPSTTGWGRSASCRTPHWRRDRAARRATTGSWTSRPRCVGCNATSAPSAATPATSPSPVNPPVACRCSPTSSRVVLEGCSTRRSCRVERSRSRSCRWPSPRRSGRASLTPRAARTKPHSACATCRSTSW